jgi:DNA-binding IclR family transcriptional regulator
MNKVAGTSLAHAYEPWRVRVRGVQEPTPPRDRKFVESLARGLEVLRAFTPADGLLGNQEIAARTRLPKATVSRLTYTLTQLGYLTHVERLAKYQLAPAALSLGYSALANMRIRQIARPFMQDLASETGATVALGTRDRLDVVYVEHCRSRSAPMLRLDLGSRIPIATTAMGRALIAAMPERERAWLTAHIARREAERWPKIRAGIERAVKDLPVRGFVLSIAEWQQDIVAVGVPLTLPSETAASFAFNCGAPEFRISRERFENDIGPRLVDMVRNVEAALSGQ